MPLYSYEDPATGLTVDVRREVADRDKPIVLKRAKKVPDRVGVIVPGGATPETDFNKRMLKAHHKKEEREGSRFQSKFDKKTIQKVWS